MKILSILISLVFSLNAISAAPYGFKGQNQTATQYSNVLQFPNSQVTKLAGINSLVETGNKNILLNPDFEHNTFNSSWTATTVTPAVETTAIISGKKSVIMSPSAQTFTFVQDSTLYASNFQGSTQLLAMVWIRTNQSGITVCSRNDGVTSTTNCVTVAPQSPSVWQLIKVPFISSSTSNGISIAASTSITGNVYIDDAFVGAVDLKTDSVQVQTQTTKFTAGSTTVNTILTGTPTTSGAGNYTVSSGTFTALRDINVTIACTTQNSTTATTQPTIYVNGASTLQKSTTDPLANLNTNTSWAGIVLSGQTFYCRNDNSTASAGQVDVLSTNTVNTQIYSTSCGANCVTEFSAEVSSTGVVSGENADFINGNCAVTDTSLYTCTWNTGIFTTGPNCLVNTTSGNNALKTDKETIPTSSAGAFRGANSTTGAKAATPFTLTCSKTGADFVAARTIVGSFNEVMTVPNVSKPKTCYYSFGGASATLAAPTECTSGTCVEVYDSCGTGTPPTWATVATYNDITFASGTFANSSHVKCDCVAYDVTAASERECTLLFQTSDNTWSSNSSGGLVLNTSTYNATGTAATSYQTISCEGQAP